MDYYRTNIAGGVVQTSPVEVNNAILNSASDSYASNYWSVPYTDGLSPMKQIEGQFLSRGIHFFSIVQLEIIKKNFEYLIKMYAILKL